MSCRETLGKLILLRNLMVQLNEEVNDEWCEGIAILTDDEMEQLQRCDRWMAEQGVTLQDIIFRLRRDNP